jgi:hypothetical protein
VEQTRAAISEALRDGRKLFLVREQLSEWGCVERGGESESVDPDLIKSLWSEGALIMTGVTNGRRTTIYELVLPAWI